MDSQGRLHTVLTPNYSLVEHAVWDQGTWSFTPLESVANYAFGVAASAGADDGEWISAWVNEGSKWKIARYDPSGSRSIVYELPGNTLMNQILTQATAPINGVETPFRMVTDNNAFPQLGAFAFIDDKPGESLVMVEGQQ